MKTVKKVSSLLVIALILLAAGCWERAKDDPTVELKRPDEAFLKYGEEYTDIVELIKINESVWVHTSYYEVNDALTSLNGLVVLTEKGLVLINAPWTGMQMESLEKLAREQFNSGFIEAIVTDAEPNYAGGLRTLMEKGIGITCLENVAEKAQKLGLFEPETVFPGNEAHVNYGDVEFEIYFPGEGYSEDNTIVWIDRYNLLFAGNIVKEYGAHSLGKYGETGKKAWMNSLNNILSRYDNIEIVIPGHGQWGDASLIDYTMGLFEE